VLSETYTLLRMRLGLRAVEVFISLLAERRDLSIEWIEADRHSAALRLLLGRRDKRWSHVDCTSFVLMHQLGVRDAFAFDQNFVQAGFRMHP